MRRWGRRGAAAFGVLLFALVVAAAAASVVGYRTWSADARQPSQAEAEALVRQAWPEAVNVSVITGQDTSGGFPLWTWFDEPTDGGYTEVSFALPAAQQGQRTDPALLALEGRMRSAGWTVQQPAPNETAELEGTRDGVYLYTDLGDEDTVGAAPVTVDLVRDSFPALRTAVVRAWLLALVAAVVLAVGAIRLSRRLPEPAHQPLRVVSWVLLVAATFPTLLATVSLAHFLDRTRPDFALDFWGVYAILLYPGLLPLVAMVPPMIAIGFVAMRRGQRGRSAIVPGVNA